jgi:hypothetical protein
MSIPACQPCHRFPRPSRDPKTSRRGALVAGLILWISLAFVPVLEAAEAEWRIRHEPAQPRTGVVVKVTLEGVTLPAAGAVLEYQDVAPGRYVAKADPEFAKSWRPVPLTRGTGGAWVAEIPAAVQVNRHLVRYRVRAAEGAAVLLPPKEDEQGNFGYFVYDGVPAWKGAVNPRGGGAAATVRTFPSENLTRVPVYHFLTTDRAVERAILRGEGERHEYRYTGTLVYDGVVYDHVGFRARGGGWRHAMGKNMWKLNFNGGHRLAAKDAYGRPYRVKWDKLNLSACIQQADYGLRGEQGMVEAVSYRLFNLAGVEAPRTHWIQFRVVTGAEETPADQYKGDFWGLYLAVEELDGAFLKEHGLPQGNLYKIEGLAPKVEYVAPGQPEDGRDASRFIGEMLSGGGVGRATWWEQNVDLDRYYSYRAILEAVHHYDISDGKNYFFYHNLAARRWQVVPWDVDLTWGDHMYGGGQEPFYQGALRQSPARTRAYQARLAELMDLLYNPEQTGRLIDEHAAQIWQGRETWSLTDADRAKWDYHPLFSSRYVMAGKTGPGMFYRGDAAARFDVMIQLMKSYVGHRQGFLNQLLRGYQPPPAPKVASLAATPEPGKPLTLAVATPGAMAVRWRVAEVTDPKAPGFDPRQPWRYEITPVWESEGKGDERVTVPGTALESGKGYRVRVRAQGAGGQWSRWSEPVEFRTR